MLKDQFENECFEERFNKSFWELQKFYRKTKEQITNYQIIKYIEIKVQL